MIDLLTAVGLMFVIEGALYALFPHVMRQMMASALLLPIAKFRIFGLIFAFLGFAIIAALRGY